MSTVLIIPGLHGSGPEHWQTWFEQVVPGAVRVEQDDWEKPILARWASRVQQAIHRSRGPVWLVAHSFGCLAAVCGAAEAGGSVAGAMLVAPADPERFTGEGLRREGSAGNAMPSVAGLLPGQQLPFASVVVASSNDPWLRLTRAAYWADRWGSRLLSLGDVGHINVEAGFGPWPAGLKIFDALREAQGDVLLGGFGEQMARRPRQRSALARLRRQTRPFFFYQTESSS